MLTYCCVSTATVVVRTLSIVMLYVDCLSCLYTWIFSEKYTNVCVVTYQKLFSPDSIYRRPVKIFNCIKIPIVSEGHATWEYANLI